MSKPKYVARDMVDLKDMLEQTVALYSDKEAFVKKAKDVNVGVNYKKFKEDVFGLGTEFLKMNFTGERVVILSENRYEWCVSFMAVVCSNGIAVPVFGGLDEAEVVSKINCVKAKVVIFSEKYRDLVKNIRKKCPELKYMIDMDTIIDDDESLSFLRLIDSGNKDIQNGNNEFVKFEVDRECGACIFWGETIIKGKPVLLSHKNLISNITGIVSFLPINFNDKTVVLQSLNEAYICICNFLVLIAQGGTICFSDVNKLDNEVFVDNCPSVVFVSKDLFYDMYRKIWADLGNMPEIRKTRLLMFISMILVKFNIDCRDKIFGDILNEFGKNLKLIVVVGNDVKNRILRDFSTFGFNVAECCNMLEATSIITVNEKRELKKELNGGVPLPGLKTRILNSNGRVPGELAFEGDFVMVGYYDDKKATQKVIVDGVLHTGKIGYKDKTGSFYFVKNRNKEENRCNI